MSVKPKTQMNTHLLKWRSIPNSLAILLWHQSWYAISAGNKSSQCGIMQRLMVSHLGEIAKFINRTSYLSSIRISLSKHVNPINKILYMNGQSNNKSKEYNCLLKQSKIYHEGSLPQNCLQLVYYCSFGISQGERHERIKNIIRRLMVLTPINYANLVDISILVHYLTCFMSETSSILLVKQIMDRILVEGSPF